MTAKETNESTPAERRAARLFALLDTIQPRTQAPLPDEQCSREAITAILQQLSDETLRDLLHKLYRLAEAQARARAARRSSVGRNRDRFDRQDRHL